ncbi:MAG: PhzF family phenazine biosynthesis protein [Bryobacteraceae bacterium]
MKLNFVTVDVFTDRQFGGNPLAVVPDARGLTSAQMQAVAAEFNLAETTFVLPPQDAAHTAQVRIFTPRAEMPFAGHPNVGTAFVLAGGTATAARPPEHDTMIFEEKAGLVRISLLKSGACVTGARLAAPQRFSIGEDIAPEIVAAACSIAVDDIDTRTHRPCIASCGAPFVFAALKSRATLAAARPRTDIFAERVPLSKATGIHLYAQAVTAAADMETRMFAPLHGITEDPATGSANVALIGFLAQLLPEPDSTLTRTISQGVDMGRPSLMVAVAEKRAGAVVATFIGGTCVPVMSGAIDLA